MEYHYKTSCLDLRQTLESGQCFRWRRQEDGSYIGISGRHVLKAVQTDDGALLTVADEADVRFWLGYFDSETDYEAVIKQFGADKTLREAAAENRGIRILRQEPFETLISFIISQNNNIPRITGIISRLCESFGDKISDEYGGMWSFPDAKTLAGLSADDLAPLRAGFRVRYILDAATKVADGTIDLGSIYGMSCDEGREYLKTITGVGNKVADCVLLFAYHKTEAFPADVWIKRITAEYYSGGLPECMGEYRGIAQQYLFEYFRKHSPVTATR
jgi:N-glycosylase/DNA lyase